MTEEEQDKRAKAILRNDFLQYSPFCLKIRDKGGNIIPFELNKAQLYIHQKIEQQRKETGKVRSLILKGRQQGCSTYVEGRFFWKVTNQMGMRAFILTHKKDATDNLFEMANRFYAHCPEMIRPSTDKSNAKELLFGKIESGYKVGTAGNKAVGRSSTIQYFHGSEVAYWENYAEHAKGILQAVPKENGTEIILESTANGIGNYFYDQWKMAEIGESEFIPIFVPWFWQDEYKETIKDSFIITDEEDELKHLYKLTNEQLLWRRNKIIELSTSGFNGKTAFQQEYPCTATEAFLFSGDDVFIPADIVRQARRNNLEKIGPLIIGVDIAAYGSDRTAIIRRKGRVSYNLQKYFKVGPMELVGKLYQIIQDEKPYKMCLDVGFELSVYERLKELVNPDILVAVNSASTALRSDRYINKRAEMYAFLKEWLMDHPCQIPDEDSLETDLCGMTYKRGSNNRLQMEKKEDMKKRGLRSPDCADALALTFAYPFEDMHRQEIVVPNRAANAINESYHRLKQAIQQRQ